MPELYLRNARIATEESVFLGGILIDKGKILQVLEGNPPSDANHIVNLDGKMLLPGIVDDHVHFNEPGREHWEGYRTGSMAAAAGGVTTIIEMPLNATPPTVSRTLLERKREVVQCEAVVDYANWGGLVDNNLHELSGLHSAGVVGFKAFLSNSGVDFERVNDDILFAGLRITGELNNLVGVHTENEFVTNYLGEQLRAAGRSDRASWYESRPPETELEAIERACYWAQYANGNLHVVHVTIPEGIRFIDASRQKGIKVTAETCPHYLVFDEEDFEEIGPAAKCAPPIRSRKTVEELWECVFAGLVDTIASDHSPCPWEDKARGMNNIWKAWGGISGVQTMLPAILTEGVHKRQLPLPDLVRMMAGNPARIFGIYPQKGALHIGSDADLIVVDMDTEWSLASDDLFYKNKHSAYVGRKFQGKVVSTYVRGKLVFQDGRIVVEPGYGQPLNRQHPYSYSR